MLLDNSVLIEENLFDIHVNYTHFYIFYQFFYPNMSLESSPINLYIAIGCISVLFILISFGIFKFINKGKKVKENEVDRLIRGVQRQQVRNAPGLRRRMNVRRDSEDDYSNDDDNIEDDDYLDGNFFL